MAQWSQEGVYRGDCLHPVLEPVDKLVWMAIMLGVQETGGNTAFPGYEAIGRIANAYMKYASWFKE